MRIRTNGEWLSTFEAYLKRRFPERSTAKHYVSDLHIFMEQHAGQLAEVTVHEIDSFVDQQRASGLASATVKRRVAALKTFFDFLAEELGPPERPNPVSMRRHGGKSTQRLPRALTDVEVEQVLATVDNLRDLAMISLMLYAGLRVGEVADLRGSNISVPEDAAAPIRLQVLGKGRKERVVYLCRVGYEPLAAYLEMQSLRDASQPIFQNRLGEPITVSGIQYRIRGYADQSGVAVTCHRLRHTYGRWMAEGEVPVLALARLLGHAQLASTQRYIDAANPQVQRAYERAMTRAAEPVAESTEPGPEAVEPWPATGQATVTRAEPSPFTGHDWMPDWPDWLHTGCVAWVQHQWWQWKPSRRQPNAQRRLGQLRAFWRWQLEQRPVRGWADLQAADVAAFVDAEWARGLAAKTVVSILDGVYAVLRYQVQQGQLTDLPARPQVTLPDPLPRHLAPTEVLALENYVSQQAAADAATRLARALYYLLAHAGLRISEALDLQVRDLDLAARRVYIREGKGRRDRVVFLTETAVTALQAYLETVPHASEDVVLQWQKQPLSYHQAWRRVRHLGEAAGVAGVTPLRLRHTYATVLLNNGMGLEGLRRLMGHEHLNTTLIYARLADETLEQQYRTAMERVTK